MTGREDQDESGGRGHPLPDSSEAREDEIPEHLVREKGHGDDSHEPASPSETRMTPGGERYEID